MNHPSLFAFTDCKDQNALTRLNARLTTLFDGSSINTIGIDTDLEAAGCILDTLDALRIGTGDHIIIGNLAPRTEKKHKNGAPFYVAYVGTTIVIATKTCFSLLFKLGLVETIGETDVETVCSAFLSREETQRITNTQFRSFEYVPLLARFAADGKKIPTTPDTLPTEFPNKAWWIDNFGNVKTTITNKELKEKSTAQSITLSFHGSDQTLPFYTRLADVPVGVLACIIGSSGYNDIRFLEIVIQGSSAAKALGFAVGDTISFV